MGHVLDGAELRRQAALRGLLLQDLADAAGLSAPTISHALAGRPISAHSLRAIAAALCRVEPLEGVEQLLGGTERRHQQAG